MQQPVDILRENERLRNQLQQMEDVVRAIRSGDVDALVDQHAASEANRLQVSEIRYRRLFEAAHDGILIVDPDTRKIIDANPFMINLLGYSLAELIGMEIFEIGLFSDAKANKDMFQTLKATGQIRYEDLPLQTEDGALREVEVVANRYDENNHSVIQFNVRDITERRQAQKALTDSDKRFRLALDNSPITVFEQDIDLRYTWIYNPKLGYAASSFIGRTDAELMEAAHARQLTTIKRGVLKTGQSVSRDVTVAAPGTPESHFNLTVEPRRGTDGQIEGIMCTAVDLTERKHAEAALRDREALQAFVLKLSDALRAEPSAEAMSGRALRMLFDEMRLDRDLSLGRGHWRVYPSGSHRPSAAVARPCTFVRFSRGASGRV